MKVLFVFGGLTHYNNDQLNKLQDCKGVEIITVSAKGKSSTLGEAVFQKKYGARFKHIELQEYPIKDDTFGYKGFSKILLQERPNIIVIIYPYLKSLIYDISTFLIIKTNGIKIILKDHPFRLRKYEEIKAEKYEIFFSNVTPNILERRLENLISKIFNIAEVPHFLYSIISKVSLPLSKIQKWRRLLKYHYELKLIRFFYQFPDAIVCYVEEAFEIFGSYGVSKNKIFITYNSPDTDILLEINNSLNSKHPILPYNENRIIHIGRLVEWKRVDLLIQALAKVKNKYNNAELLVLGYGPEEDRLKKISIELDVFDNIKFLGGIYDPVLIGQYLKSSSIYVLAGMGGLSINDAMCFGLPIICSVCDGTEKKLLKDNINGKYFLEGDEADLADKIDLLLSDKILRDKMGKNSIKIIEDEINIHTVINGYVAAFEYVTNYQ